MRKVFIVVLVLITLYSKYSIVNGNSMDYSIQILEDPTLVFESKTEDGFFEQLDNLEDNEVSIEVTVIQGSWKDIKKNLSKNSKSFNDMVT